MNIDILRKALAEFVGTFTLLFAVVVSIVTADQVAGLFGIALAQGIAIAIMVSAVGHISGAHFNPAVTIGLASIRQIRPPEAVLYIIFQCIGAILGALLTKALLNDEGAAVNYGAVGISDRLSDKVFLGALCEGIGTFFLVWAIIGVAVNPAGLKDWAGLAIGTTLGFLVMIFGPLTGAGLNPARSLGPALVGNAFGGAGEFIIAFVLAPVIGAVAAALLYTFVFTTPGKKGVEGLDPVG
jgi:MIP family channel proteins